MGQTINQVLRETTLDYLNSIDMANPPTPDEIEEHLLIAIHNEFEAANACRSKGDKWRIPQKLEFSQIANIMAHMYHIARIRTAGAGASSAFDLLAIYQTEGPNEGIYVTDEEVFREIARKYNYNLRNNDFNELMIALRDLVPRVDRCQEPNLIAVNNGIFDYDTKQLLPFSPDYVFLSKSRINYNPNATNVVIHNDEDGTDWDVESWMSELSDDPEIVNVLWEILGAIVRPHVSWNKSAWFYSESGNNGKGTLCELMRALCGDGSYASIPLSEMSKDFALEPLIRATAIIVDENDVGTYIDKAANLKAIVTNDVIQINRKFKTPIAYKFKGFMVQCLNEMPRVRDKSDSFFRRQIFVPFTKCFTGKERKYIKHDYLHRQNVLEYVLHRVLHMDYYELTIPDACIEALNDYKEYNDPIRQFVEDVINNTTWDLLPFQFLFDIYQQWFKKNVPSGTPQSKSTFTNDLINVMNTNTEWSCTKKKIRPSNRMIACEPLIDEYKLIDWMNPQYAKIPGTTMEQRCTPDPNQLKTNYTGLVRIKPKCAVPPIVAPDDATT